MQNEEIKFKIIKAEEGVEKPKEVEKIEKPKEKVKIHFEEKRAIKFNFLYLILPILIIGGSVYFFLFYKKEKPITKLTVTNKEPIEETPIINPFAKTTTTITTTEIIATVSTPTEAAITVSTPTIATPTVSTPTEATPTKATSEIVVATKTETTKITTKIEEKLEPKSPKPEEIKEIVEKEIKPQGEKVSYFGLDFPSISIKLDSLTNDGFKDKWLDLLRIQKTAGSIYKIEFSYNNTPIDGKFIKDYFLKPSFIEEKYINDFKDSLTDNYGILFYYTYTRKFPIIIFEIKDDFSVTTFMRLWDKESILKDFNLLYYGLPKGKLLRNYTITENYKGIDYKIGYFDNNYKFIWTIYNNKLIISTTLSGFKGIIDKLK
ncbi:MAG: hypothetical protein ACP5JU_01580 [Minisyncoccia bacterium]